MTKPQNALQTLEERQLALIDQTEKLNRLVYKLFKRVQRIEAKLGIDPHAEAKAAREREQREQQNS